jgi:hypothetical protein
LRDDRRAASIIAFQIGGFNPSSPGKARVPRILPRKPEESWSILVVQWADLSAVMRASVGAVPFRWTTGTASR